MADDPPRPDKVAIRTFARHIIRLGNIHEVRIIKSRRGPARLFGTVSGYFDDPDRLADAVANITGDDAESIYITMNPVEPDLIARAFNRLENAAKSTSADADVTYRQCIVVDVDPERKSGISATDAERDAAIKVRDAVRSFLAEHDWPDPVAITMSGNGGGLVYRVDLPNDDDAAAIVSSVLTALGELFNVPDQVSIDQTVHNAARLTKIPGTVAAKGDHTDRRPWRLATAEYPDNPGVVSIEQLSAIAALRSSTPKPKPVNRSMRVTDAGERTWTLEQLLEFNGLPINPKPWQGGATAYLLDRCLTSHDHTDGARIIEGPDGKLGYRCHHDSCQGKDWQYLREHGLILIPGQSGQPYTGHTNGHKPEEVAALTADDLSPVPAFPIDALPEPFRTFVKQGATNLGCPPEMIALPTIALTAGTLGNSYALRLKRDWFELPIVWGAIVAPPGGAKTPAMKYASMPVGTLQQAAWEEWQYRLEEYERDLDEYDRLKRDKNQPTPEKPKRPELEHYYTTDSTVEALARMLGQNNTPGLTMLRDELVGWIRSFDAYRQAGDRQLWMSLWAGFGTKVDRASKDPIYIRHPAVSVIGGIQPDLLNRLEEEAALRDGFIDRFLVAYPEHRPMRFADDVGDDRTPDDVRRLFTRIRPGGDTRDVQLSPDAKALFTDFYNQNAEAQDGKPPLAQGYMAKLPIQLARLALILHCMTNPDAPDTMPLSSETMYQAIRLAGYFQQHAMRVFGHFGIAAQVQDPLAPRIVRALESCGGSATSTEIYDALGRNVNADDRNRALALLESAGMLYREPIPTGTKGGRPGYRFILRDSPDVKTVETVITPKSHHETGVSTDNTVITAGVSSEKSGDVCRECGQRPERKLFSSGLCGRCHGRMHRQELNGRPAGV